MSFLNELLTCEKYKLPELVRNRIDELSEFSYTLNDSNIHTIGAAETTNPIVDIVDQYDKKIDSVKETYGCSLWFGYLPKDIKIAYYSYCDKEGKKWFNAGNYYYADFYPILLEFSKVFRSKADSLKNDYDLLLLIDNFIDSYSMDITKEYYDRCDIHNALLDSNLNYIDPIKRDISDFKHMNAFECSEISLFAHNILSFLGYNSIYSFGNIKLLQKLSDGTIYERDNLHAYLLTEFDGYLSIVDLSSSVNSWDVNSYDKIKTLPFVEKLIPFDPENFDAFMDKYMGSIIWCKNGGHLYLSDGLYSINTCSRIYSFGQIFSENKFNEEIKLQLRRKIDINSRKPNIICKWGGEQ